MHYEIVEKIEFGVLSAEEIRRQSLVKITSTKDFNGRVPIDKGLYDRRLGSNDFRNQCLTCQDVKPHLSTSDCASGHIGYMDLVTECFHPGFLNLITRVLVCFCYFCSSLWPDRTENVFRNIGNLSKEERLKLVSKTSKSLKKPDLLCRKCGGNKAVYKKKGSTSIVRLWAKAIWTDPHEQEFSMLPFTAKIAKRILINASEADYEFLGIQKQFVVNCIMECLPVMAPTFHPIQDDLTIKLSKIREVNEAFRNYLSNNNCWHLLNVEDNFKSDLQKKLPQATKEHVQMANDVKGLPSPMTTDVPPTIVASETMSSSLTATGRKKRKPLTAGDHIYKYAHNLQLQIGSFYSNAKAGDDVAAKAPTSSMMVTNQSATGNFGSSGNSYANGAKTNARKNVHQRLKGKPGRFRCNLSAKRNNFSGRICITPDGTLDLDQVGIPEQIAIVLTVIETVNTYNIRALTKRVKIGYGKVQGACSVWFKATNTFKKLSHVPTSIEAAEAMARFSSNNVLKHFTTHDIALKFGDKVERYLQNNDRVLLNRQPSLHKQSIMAHRVVIVPECTLRLNLTATTPYNADFDGDEMNIDVCQSIEAQAEMQEIMSVSKQAINGQNNRPLFGYKQDPLIGWYLLSKKDTFLTKQEWINICMGIHYPDNFPESEWASEFEMPIPAILKPVPLWTGKQLFSKMLPPDFDYHAFVRKFNDDTTVTSKIDDSKERIVLIENGDLLSGQLCKETLGATKHSIFHVLGLNYDAQQFNNFVSDAQRVANIWFKEEGFSVGLDDLETSSDLKTKVKHDLDHYLTTFKSMEKTLFDKTNIQIHPKIDETSNVQNIDAPNVDGMLMRLLDNPSSEMLEMAPLLLWSAAVISDLNVVNNAIVNNEVATFGNVSSSNYSVLKAQQHRVMYKMEPDVSQSLNRVLVSAQRYLDTMNPNNSMLSMVMSGSKGTVVNFCQMAILVGQNDVNGQRLNPIKSDYAGYDSFYARSLPCLDPYDTGNFEPQQHGFIRKSYLDGLVPPELFEQTKAGRSGLNDTATKASEIGYSNRRVVKMAESVVVQTDRTVRDICKNRIIQFTYGGDNLDASFIQDESFSFLSMSDFQLKEHIEKIIISDNEMCESIVALLLTYKHQLTQGRETLVDITNNTTKSTKLLVSVDVKRRIKMFYAARRTSFDTSILLDTNTFDHLRRSTMSTSTSITPFDILKVYFKHVIKMYGYWPTLNIRTSLLWHFVTGNQFCPSTLDCVEYLFRCYVKTHVAYGETVGLLAAAAVGEPSSQLTFNTFHLAGLSSTSTTQLGFARVMELLQLTVDIKAPTTRLVATSDSLCVRGLEQTLPVVYFHQLVNRGKITTHQTVNPHALPNVNTILAKELGLSTMKLVYRFKAIKKTGLTPYRIVEMLHELFGIHNVHISIQYDNPFAVDGVDGTSADTSMDASINDPYRSMSLVFQIMNVQSLIQLTCETENKRKKKDSTIDATPKATPQATPVRSTPRVNATGKTNVNGNANSNDILLNASGTSLLMDCLGMLQAFLAQNLPIQGIPGIQNVRFREKPIDYALNGIGVDTHPQTILDTHLTKETKKIN